MSVQSYVFNASQSEYCTELTKTDTSKSNQSWFWQWHLCGTDKSPAEDFFKELCEWMQFIKPEGKECGVIHGSHTGFKYEGEWLLCNTSYWKTVRFSDFFSILLLKVRSQHAVRYHGVRVPIFGKFVMNVYRLKNFHLQYSMWCLVYRCWFAESVLKWAQLHLDNPKKISAVKENHMWVCEIYTRFKLDLRFKIYSNCLHRCSENIHAVTWAA